MKKLTFLIAISFSVFYSVMAQKEAFTIILNKGENKHISGSSAQPLILGETLNTDEKISVAKGGYVALLHEQSGSSIELKDAGTYTVAELEQQIAEQSNSVFSKYGKFLMSKLNPEGTGNQNLNVTGAVERGDAGFINVYLPKVTDVFESELLVVWQQPDEVQNYIVTIKNHRDEVISQKRVKGNKYKLSFDQAPLKDLKLMTINITADDNSKFTSKDYGINRISAEQKRDLEKEYSSLKKVARSENVVDKLLIATFFEENELLGDAINYYDQALALSPDVNGFDRLYNNFLYRNNLK
jgi:hypothetical protein